MVSCIQCRGKGLCYRGFCPIFTKAESMFKSIELIDKDFYGASPPTIFVGSKLIYPEVNVGILSPPKINESTKEYDNPVLWYEKNYDIKKIVELRSSLINSRFRAKVLDVRNTTKFLDIAQEVAMASKSANLEINLDKKPKIRINFENIGLPMGPNANLKNVRVTENIHIFKPVEKIFYDYDMKAVDGVRYLYEKGFNEYDLAQFLSVGVMGLKKNRKLVPTKWSITGIDDMLGKHILSEIKNYEIIVEHRLYIGNYLGNYYYIMLFPDVFSYELYEGYMPGAIWNFSGNVEFATDFESVYGRKSYASNTVGGYYSARVAVLEKLKELKKQASILAIRFETPEYSAPLGVWVVKQAARRTLSNDCIKFEDKNKMIDYVINEIKNKFKYNISELIKNSKLVRNLKNQIKLNNFFN